MQKNALIYFGAGAPYPPSKNFEGHLSLIEGRGINKSSDILNLLYIS